MSRSYGNFSNIAQVLQGLVDQQVTVILSSGQKIIGCVDAVLCEQKSYGNTDGTSSCSCGCGGSSGRANKMECNLLVMSTCNRIIFVDINCICAVCTCCEEVLEFALNNMRSHGRNKACSCSREEDEIFQ